MSEIKKEQLEAFLSLKLNKELTISAIELIGSGYHSDGYKVTTNTGEEFFVKRIKSDDMGFEVPERKLHTLLISDAMTLKTQGDPTSFGVLVVNNDEPTAIPQIRLESEIYHIQNFRKGVASYWQLLLEKKEKQSVDKQDLSEIQKVVASLAHIHAVKYPSEDQEKLHRVYNDGLTSIITNPELTYTWLNDYTDDFLPLPFEQQKEHVGLMFEVVHRWKNRFDRLCALHGDCWGANLYFDENNEAYFIDYSRIPWGDPGIDVGWWLSQYLLFYAETENPYFRELGEAFLSEYEKITGDTEIRSALCLTLGLMAIIYMSPRIFPDRPIEVSRKLYAAVKASLTSNTLQWQG